MTHRAVPRCHLENINSLNVHYSTNGTPLPRKIQVNSSSNDSKFSRIILSSESLNRSKLVRPIVKDCDLDFSSEFTSKGGESTTNLQDLPSQELLLNIVRNLEYHFSDETLSRDLFLLKHIKRQPEGYVSLKLLTGYKKVKKLSRDWRVVGTAIKQSKLLELNDNGTRVRRSNPLPSSLAADLPSSRTLVALDIPQNLNSIESLANKFSVYGSVVSLQIIKPGKGNSPELFAMLQKLNINNDSTSAILEFEDIWGASKALQDKYDPPMTLHVFRNTKRRERSTTELRIARPLHYKLHRLIDESSKRFESRGPEDESRKDGLKQEETCRYLSTRHRISSTVLNSPTSRRGRFTHQPLQIRSPRGPDGSKGFYQFQRQDL